MMITKPARAANGKTWCGPYALALITGKTYEDVLPFIRRAAKRKRIMGMYNWEFQKTARRMGLRKFEFKKIPSTQRTNLSNMTDWLRPNRIYVVQVTSHYVIVNTKDWTMTDNQTEGWIPISSEHKNGRRRLCAYAEAFRIAD